MPHPVTLQLLRNFYQSVRTLRGYLEAIGLALVPQDEQACPDLLDHVLVTQVQESAPPKLAYTIPDCTLDELLRTVQHQLLRLNSGKGSRNVLTMGYLFNDRGLSNVFVNTTLNVFRDDQWHRLLDRAGITIVRHLLADCSLFVPLPNEGLCQLAGAPINDLKPTSAFVTAPLPTAKSALGKRKSEQPEDDRPRKRAKLGGDLVRPAQVAPSSIVLGRSTVFYARPRLEPGSNRMAVGLPPLHILNKLKRRLARPVSEQSQATQSTRRVDEDGRQLLQHMFPRQHKLPSVFSPGLPADKKPGQPIRTPKRLEPLVPLAMDLVRRHIHCNYRAIRGRCCPSKLEHHPIASQQPGVILEFMSETSMLKTQVTMPQSSADISFLNTTGGRSRRNISSISSAIRNAKVKPKFAEFMCSHYEVFAFVKSVTLLVIPNALWGNKENKGQVLKHVWHTIRQRRYESTTLHAVMQGLELSACTWTHSQSAPSSRPQRPNLAESTKRRELMEDFIHWYFESFILPIIKTSFYVTESSAFRNRVLYFRQDDWKRLCQPLVDRLTESTFEKLDPTEVAALMPGRMLGASFVRLLPKETGVRPLVNLSFRGADESIVRARSINQMLQATFQILTHEKSHHPAMLGASTFGVNDIYARLKTFRSGLVRQFGKLPKLYFVKVDLKACFDSIEQGKLLEILAAIVSHDEYTIQRFAQINPTAGRVRKSSRKLAWSGDDRVHFLQLATELAGLLRHSIFVDQVHHFAESRSEILALLREHITANIVKIDNQYYRQRVGIPQGSAISTLLCSFFYGSLEMEKLHFVSQPGNALLRYVDDYCFVTADLNNARRFLVTMTNGHPEYGAFVVPEKTLINFDHGVELAQRTLATQTHFPWCGLLIDMKTLSITVDYSRYYATHLGDFLTVDSKKKPDKTFLHKMLRLAKHKTHAIYCDTTLSSQRTVYINIYESFLLSAMKMHCYLRDCKELRSKQSFIFHVVQQTIKFTQVALRHATRHGIAKKVKARCTVSRMAVSWLGWHAFASALERRQSAHPVLLPLVQAELRAQSSGPSSTFDRKFGGIIRRALQDFADIDY